jgi:hypothetical protein
MTLERWHARRKVRAVRQCSGMSPEEALATVTECHRENELEASAPRRFSKMPDKAAHSRPHAFKTISA